MELKLIIEQLAANAQRIRVLASRIPDTQARWRAESGSWSILEVVSHLLDEETEDFRARLNLILLHPGDPWLRIDPGAWVTERHYNERDLGDTLAEFLNARAESLLWLQTLETPDWNAPYVAPFGRITAGDVLSSWLAHDMLHMRQIIELQWAFAMDVLTPPYRVIYAGEW